MKLCRFRANGSGPRLGLSLDDDSVADLSSAGLQRVHDVLALESPAEDLRPALERARMIPLSRCRLLPPVDAQEVWAAGLTYPLARTARMLESPISAVVHNLIYEAERPKIFFKALAEKVVTSGDAVGVRSDSKWSIPEPELALMLNGNGAIRGYAVANDMSSRDIEGENVLYSPQAKIYHRSCAIGPWVRLDFSPEEIRAQTISISVMRHAVVILRHTVALSTITRAFEDLAAFLFRCQRFPHGVVLLTGNGIVSPDAINLLPGDVIEIQITGIGSLVNTVVPV